MLCRFVYKPHCSIMISTELEIWLLKKHILHCKVAALGASDKTVGSFKFRPVTELVISALADGRQCSLHKVHVGRQWQNIQGLRAFAPSRI